MKLRSSRPLALACCLLAAAAAVRAAADARAVPALTPIPSLDTARYLGTWYEIAKYPNRFQAQCTGFTTAHYSQRPDGTIRVVNRCRLANGQYEEAVGVARQIGGAASPRLEVRFAPAWLSFLPMVWGDYWVIDLDRDYQLAAVSEPGREYLWILARTPVVAPQAYQALLDRLAREGFDLGRLERTPQQ